MEPKLSTLESAIREISKQEDRDLLYQNFGKFVAQFEDHVEHIRIMNYQILAGEGFKNEVMFSAIISGYPFQQLLSLLRSLVHQKFKPGEPTSLDQVEYEKLIETNKLNLEYILRVDYLLEGSGYLSEIRNYLVHGQWMEFYPIHAAKDPMEELLPVDIMVYQTKHKKGKPDHKYRIVDAKFFKTLSDAFEELRARYLEMSEFIDYRSHDTLSTLEVYERAAKAIQKVKDSASIKVSE